MELTRRGMMAGGIAAAALSAGVVRAADPGLTRRIPSTGVEVPAVGLGTWITFNVGDDPVLIEDCADVVAAFAGEGGGMIDSSPMYGSSQGTVGHALRTRGVGEAVFSADKVWTSSVEAGPDQIAESRREWGVPAFDLLQVHNLVAWEGHLDTLFAMQAEGRLAHVGVTTSHGRSHETLERVMRDHPIDVVQLTYNLADREAEARLLPLAAEKGIAVIANRPYRRGALPRRLAGAPLPGVASEIGAADWPTLLLRFILSHPSAPIAIPATTRVDHVRQNKAAARGPMPDAAMRRAIVAHFESL